MHLAPIEWSLRVDGLLRLAEPYSIQVQRRLKSFITPPVARILFQNLPNDGARAGV